MNRLLPFLCIVAIFFSGCGARRDRTRVSRYEDRDPDAMDLMIVTDTSGSFVEHMTKEGKAWDLTVRALDKYTKDRAGSSTEDQIILANISGNERSIMWKGSPRSFRSEFPSKEKFHSFLLSHSDPGGSRVNDGIAHALGYINSKHKTRHGQSVTLILSDMLDTYSDPGSETRLIKAMAEYNHDGGEIGIYFCDQLQHPKLMKRCEEAGLKWIEIECDFVGKPKLPDLH